MATSTCDGTDTLHERVCDACDTLALSLLRRDRHAEMSDFVNSRVMTEHKTGMTCGGILINWMVRGFSTANSGVSDVCRTGVAKQTPVPRVGRDQEQVDNAPLCKSVLIGDWRSKRL